MDKILIREARTSDLDRCYEIEITAYAGDEAATREKIGKRIELYPEGFLVLEFGGVVVGLVNSGATDHVQLSDESFKELIGHDPRGEKIVIMSVAVHPDYQKRGFASKLLQAFINKMKMMGKSEIHLICQTALIDMYAVHGFIHLGKSDSDHGGLHWHEMKLAFQD